MATSSVYSRGRSWLADYIKTNLNLYSKDSYSQEGEDLVLERFFDMQRSGFYVDVGAHHPIKYSNTYKFYKAGWRGINIDAAPGSMKPFDKYRSRDINLEIPVSSVSESKTFYIFNEPALSGFDKDLTAFREGLGDDFPDYHVVEQRQLKTQTLSSILDQYLPPDIEIDFLSIDVEGLDLEVLKSNDWDKYRPKVVLVEIIDCQMENMNQFEEYKFLVSKGYGVGAKCLNTVFFVDQAHLNKVYGRDYSK